MRHHHPHAIFSTNFTGLTNVVAHAPILQDRDWGYLPLELAEWLNDPRAWTESCPGRWQHCGHLSGAAP